MGAKMKARKLRVGAVLVAMFFGVSSLEAIDTPEPQASLAGAAVELNEGGAHLARMTPSDPPRTPMTMHGAPREQDIRKLQDLRDAREPTPSTMQAKGVFDGPVTFRIAMTDGPYLQTLRDRRIARRSGALAAHSPAERRHALGHGRYRRKNQFHGKTIRMALEEVEWRQRQSTAAEDRIFDGPITLRDAMEERLEIQARRDARVGEGKSKSQFVTSAQLFEHPLQYRMHVHRSRRVPAPPVKWSVRWDRMGKPAPYDGYETPGLPERARGHEPMRLEDAFSGLDDIQQKRNARQAKRARKATYGSLWPASSRGDAR